MGKIAFLGAKVAARPLLASVAESEELEAVICLVRQDGRWSTCWSSGIDMGSLCMSSMKFQNDVIAFIHDADEGKPFGGAA